MAGLHLLGSCIVVGLVMSVIYFIWYPYPYYIFHSTISATKLVVSVDLVLGPLLTFVVFSKAKPAIDLKRDLAIIIIVQISALIWGGYVTHSVRPLFAVYFDGEIHSITGVSIDDSGFDPSVNFPGFLEQPLPVYIKPLSKEDYRLSISKQLKGLQLGFVLQTQYYKNINNAAKKDMRSRSLSLKQLTMNEYSDKIFHEYLEKSKFKFDDVLFYPVNAGPYSGVAVVDKETMRIVDKLEIYIKNTSEYN
jgi:hypothetical protein